MLADLSNLSVQVTDQPLDLQTFVNKVSVDSAGAVATFSGVTRNHFNSQTVTQLEYEAYTPMAHKKLQVHSVNYLADVLSLHIVNECTVR